MGPQATWSGGHVALAKRHLWDSNPRGETPSAQQADALAARPKCQCGDEHGGVIRRAAHERGVRLVSPKHMTAWFSGVHNWGPLLFGRSVDEHGGVTGRAASERGVRFVSPRHMTAWFSGVHKLGATCDFVSDKQSPVVQELPHQRHLWDSNPRGEIPSA